MTETGPLEDCHGPIAGHPTAPPTLTELLDALPKPTATPAVEGLTDEQIVALAKEHQWKMSEHYGATVFQFRLSGLLPFARALLAASPVPMASSAEKFSCHLERDHGKAPCDRDCGKLRCMYPTTPSASSAGEPVGRVSYCGTKALLNHDLPPGAPLCLTPTASAVEQPAAGAPVAEADLLTPPAASVRDAEDAALRLLRNCRKATDEGYETDIDMLQKAWEKACDAERNRRQA